MCTQNLQDPTPLHSFLQLHQVKHRMDQTAGELEGARGAGAMKVDQEPSHWTGVHRMMENNSMLSWAGQMAM